MKSIHDLTKEDWAAIVAKASLQMIFEKKQLEEFYNSEKCNYLIESIKKSGKTINNEEINYFFKKICKQMGWKKVSDKEVHDFFNVMSSTTIGEIKNEFIDKKCPFPNVEFEKNGLKISIMSGQGTSICIGPIGE